MSINLLNIFNNYHDNQTTYTKMTNGYNRKCLRTELWATLHSIGL